MSKRTQRYCRHDDMLVLAEKDSPNQILHLILTVLTAGLWLVVWIAVNLPHHPYRCPHCGGKTDGVWLYHKLRRKRGAVS